MGRGSTLRLPQMSRSKKVQPALPWKVYVSSRKPDSFQGTANRLQAGSNPRFVQETCFGRTKKAQGRKGPEPPGRGASWGPGWAPRAPLSAREQRYPPTLPPLRRPGPAGHTRKASPVLGARARTRVPGLPWESAPGVLGIRRVARNRILLCVLLNLLGPSRDTRRPQRQSGSPSPHIWSGADVSLGSWEQPRRPLGPVRGRPRRPPPRLDLVTSQHWLARSPARLCPPHGAIMGRSWLGQRGGREWRQGDGG